MKLTAEDQAFLADYDASIYERPSLTADTVLFRLRQVEESERRQLQILLVQRKSPPYAGGWALPGGFCEIDETLADCADRELKEETGLEGYYYGQIATYDAVERDPRTRVVTTAQLAILPYGKGDCPLAGDDAAVADWFDVNLTHVKEGEEYRIRLELNNDGLSLEGSLMVSRQPQGWYQRKIIQEPERLAFDHLEVIAAAVTNLRHQVYSTDLPYRFLPEVFSFKALKAVFEACIGQELVRSTLVNQVKHQLKRISPLTADLPFEEQEYSYIASESDVLPRDIWR